MNQDYHIPVLAEQTVDGLNIKPSGIYVDVTFGGGGHSEIILKKLSTGKLFAFDQDFDAEKNANILIEKYGKENFIFVRSNFKFIKNFLKFYQITSVDGIIADLGVSSHQIDTPERGFSFMQGDIPDMRMNKEAEINAFKIINEYTEEELYKIFKNYAEIKNPYHIVKDIISARLIETISSIQKFNEIISKRAPQNKEYKFLAKIYQAVRIETNNELDSLEQMLLQSVSLIKKGGRFSVLTYHSLEDRIVKNFFKTGNFEGITQKDLYGNNIVPFKQINNKVIIPDDIEINQNSRARSAKLRIAEKL